jgi:hypothetical protein
MGLELSVIQETFPHGVRLTGKDKWLPADSPEAAVKPLRQMLADKRKRREKPRLLSTRNPRQHLTYNKKTKKWETRPWDYNEERGYNEISDPLNAGEAVDQLAQKQISKDAEEKFEREEGRKVGMDAERANQPLSERVRAIEDKVRPQQLASLERRIKALERATHDKAA